MKNKFFCAHAHFYQPPRENPWTMVCEFETQAIPYRDFNRKITDECYGPLSLPKIKSHSLDAFVSLYSHISFNFGPTLLSWIEDHYPRLFTAIREADSISAKIYGEGSAIAQVYNHRIMPHCSTVAKKIQIQWGMDYFQSKFKRKAKAIWLAETAVDEDTLEALIVCDVEFVILSAFQAESNGQTLEDSKTLQPYVFYSKQQPGKKLSIFFFNSALSQKIKPEMANTEKYYMRILSSFSPDKSPQLLSIASDGENYGHHLKNGYLYLAALIEKILKDKRVFLTNYATYLKQFPAQKEISIRNNTAWSCTHGLGRWERNCGCRISQDNKDQSWRKTLKDFSDKLQYETEKIYFEKTKKIFKDPTKTLLSYWECIDKKSPLFILSFVRDRAFKDVSPTEIKQALSALEMIKNAQYAATSCAWFFDDITSIEPLKALKFAWRAAERAMYLGEDIFTLFKILEDVKSNIRGYDGHKILSFLKEESKTPYFAMFAFAAKIILGYDVPFETHYDYRFRVLKENVRENSFFFHISLAELSTFIKHDFFVHIKKTQDNLFFSARRAKLADFETNIKSERLEFESNLDISSLMDEEKAFVKIFLSHQKQDLKLATFIRKMAIAGLDIDKAFEAFEIIEKDEKPFSLLEKLPFAYDYMKHFITVFAGKNIAYERRIKSFLSISPYSKLTWKYDLIKNSNYDNKKTILEK